MGLGHLDSSFKIPGQSHGSVEVFMSVFQTSYVLTKWNMQRADISMGGPLFIFCCFVLGLLRYFFLTLCKLGWFR